MSKQWTMSAVVALVSFGVCAGLGRSGSAQAAPGNERKQQCDCGARTFVGLTSGRYSAGVGVPGACSLQPSIPCLVDTDCANSGNAGSCQGAVQYPNGFTGADARCQAEFPDSVVCTTSEVLESVRSGALAAWPTNAWYNDSQFLENPALRWNNGFTSPVWPLVCCR